jgi:hypothetical protein
MAKEITQKDDLSSEIKNPSTDYVPGQKLPGEMPEEVKKEMDKTREKLDKVKNENP